MTSLGGNEGEEAGPLASGPSRRACSFKSMTSFGSHYRVLVEEEGVQHVTFDLGVAVLKDRGSNCALVELARVGILKNIILLNYGHKSIVLMVVLQNMVMNVGIFYIIMLVPQNIVMDLNNVMLTFIVCHIILLKGKKLTCDGTIGMIELNIHPYT